MTVESEKRRWFLHKETKPTKQEGVGTFVREIFLTEFFRSESPFPSRSLLPSVNCVSEFELKGG